jgi:hypothetical protein
VHLSTGFEQGQQISILGSGVLHPAGLRASPLDLSQLHYTVHEPITAYLLCYLLAAVTNLCRYLAIVACVSAQILSGNVQKGSEVGKTGEIGGVFEIESDSQDNAPRKHRFWSLMIARLQRDC